MRQTLELFETPEEAFKREAEVVSESLSDPLCLNLAEGGCVGPLFKGRKHSEETLAILKEKSTGRKGYTTPEGIAKAKATKLKKNNGNYFSQNTIEKIRKSALMRYADARKNV